MLKRVIAWSVGNKLIVIPALLMFGVIVREILKPAPTANPGSHPMTSPRQDAET